MIAEDERLNCPPELANEFSNQELDEFRDLFTNLDEDGSGAISSTELGQIFTKLDDGDKWLQDCSSTYSRPMISSQNL